MPTVLVADDSPVALLTVSRRLRAEGWDVSSHESAASATAAPPLPDLVCALLDLDLGDGDGTDVATSLRARHPALPVAFFSASSSDDVLTRARALGPVFIKPDQLEAALAWVTARVSERLA